MRQLLIAAIASLLSSAALAAVHAHGVREVVEAMRGGGVPLSFIEANTEVRVVVDEEWPTDKLIAEIARQSDRYAYAEVVGHRVLFAREPRYRLRMSDVNIKAMPRIEAVNAYVALLNNQSPEFADFSGWVFLGGFAGGVPPYIPLVQDKVTLTPVAEVMEHFAQLLGDDKQLFFDVDRSGLSYGTVQRLSAQSPVDVVARIHGQPVLRRETPRGDVLYDRIAAQLLQEWAATIRLAEKNDWIRIYKLHQRLWRDFGGGRVVIRKFGPEPFDAYLRFLQIEQKKGSFVIVDDDLRAAFWDHFDGKHEKFADQKQTLRFMTTPWWTEK